MPKFSKQLGDFFFLIEADNLLIIPYQLTKFQVPCSNAFRDISLTSLNAQIVNGP